MDYNKFKTLSADEAFAAASEFSGAPVAVFDRMWTKESSRGSNMGPSKAGATGHFQQMPPTLAAWQKRLGKDFDPHDFHDGLYMAAHQIKENLGIAKGNLGNALRMYNSGMKPEKWDNPETNDYVDFILGEGASQPKLDDVTLMTTRAADVRAASREVRRSTSMTKEHLSDVEKALLQQAGARALAEGVVDTDGVMLARDTARGNFQAELDTIFTKAKPDLSTIAVQAASIAAELSGKDAVAKRDAVTMTERIGAAWDRMDTVRIIQNIGKETFPTDPSFDYIANIDEIEKGFTGRELDQLREARSMQEVESIKREIAKDRELDQILYGQGMAKGFMTQVGLGLLDPVGWAAGLGVGKTIQLAGIGSRALAAAGRSGAAVGSIAAEGALGNVLVEAALDASGNNVSLNDYAISATVGSLFGLAASPFALSSGRRMAVENEARAVQQNALDAERELYLRAQERAGEGASPVEIAKAAEDIQKEDIMQVVRTALAPVPEADQILRVVDEGTVFKPVHTEADITRLGLDALVSDPEQRGMIAEMIVRAERWTKDNPVDPDRASRLLKMTGMESTGQVLAQSKSPVAQMVAATLLENTTGSVGRRRTAALSAHMRERSYVEPVLRDYESAYTLYRNSKGGNAIGDLYGGEVRSRFDREVAMEREARRSGSPVGGPPHPMVKRAADLLDKAYDHMRIEQQAVRTIGSARLGSSSVGYMPHLMSPEKVLGLSVAEHRVIQSELSRQFQTRLEFDTEFADQLAVKYIERMRDRAMGRHQVPVNITNPYASEMVESALQSMGLTPEQVAAQMGKFSRGGAAHTKQRLDLDLNAEYIKDDGTAGTLIDLFNTDQMGLLRSYARRTASEVALTQYGILGGNGLKLLGKAIQETGATPQEMKAFDQIAAEFLNQPFGNEIPAWMDNVRVLTSTSRLGGMGFTQMGEYANGIGAVGIQNVFRSVAAFPQMLKAISGLKKGQMPKDPILNSLDIVGGTIGGEGYRMVGLYDVAENAVQTYGRDSVGVVSRAIRAGGNVHARLSFHRAVSFAQQRGMAQQIVHKAVRFIQSGKEDKALDDMGINAALRAAMKKDLSKIAKFDKSGNLVEFDITKGDPQAGAAFTQAVQRGASQIIQQTYIGETGKWAHDGFLKLLTQFRTFSLTSVEKQWTRQTSVHGAKAAGYLIGAAAFAVPIHFLRISAASIGMSSKEREEYIERRTSPLALSQAVLNYVSLSGFLSDALMLGASAADTLSGGGFSDAIGSPRGGRSDPLSQVAPAAGWFNDVFSGDIHKAAKALPFSNLPYISPIMNLLK